MLTVKLKDAFEKLVQTNKCDFKFVTFDSLNNISNRSNNELVKISKVRFYFIWQILDLTNLLISKDFLWFEESSYMLSLNQRKYS